VQTAAAAATESVGVITASIIFGAFILKAVDLVKYLVQGLRGDWNSFITLLLTWIVGFVAVMLFIKTQWGDEVKLGDQTLDQLNTSAKIVFSLAAPSIAALLYDAKKAVDNTDTASSPRLTEAAETARKERVASALGQQSVSR
jgi:predicted tellurium resistance membrane protein TerC